jgi:hypothetical protein
MFATGAIIGSVVTWQILKRKYDALINKEIESVIETFSRRNEECTVEKEETDNEPKIPEQITFEDLERKEYDKLTVLYKVTEEVDVVEKPYVIPPEEFGEREGYDYECLTYYADGVLTDEAGEVIEDVDDIVGLGFETHFGEYEDDSVHIRNDKYETDYEILRDLRRYSDLLKENPHQAEAE